MANFFQQTKSGLTLLETVIALLVISVSLPLLFGLQVRLLRQSGNTLAHITHMTDIKNMLVKAHQNRWFEKRQSINEETESGVILQYAARNLSASQIKHVVQEEVTGTWQTGLGGKRTDYVVSFMFVGQSKQDFPEKE